MLRPALRQPSLFATLATGCLYFVAAAAALLLSRFEGGLAFIWGANAFLMAELLTSSMCRWPRTLIVCAVASAAATAMFGMGPMAALPMAAINILESLIVAILCRRFASEHMVMGSIRPLVVFILSLTCVADIVTGLLAASVAAMLTPVSFGASFWQWYTGHALGGLTCAPILIMLLQGELGRWVRETPAQAKVEAALLLMLFALSTVHIFYWARYPMLFAPLLPLVLIAFRVGQMGAAASIIILALIGGTATLSGVGPLTIIPVPAGDRVQFFQFYVALSFLLCMPVAAELHARRRLFHMLEESETRFRAIAEHSGDVVLNISVAGMIDYASPSAHEQIGCAPELLIGQSAANLVDPQDRALVIAAHRNALAQPGSIHKAEFRPLVSIADLDWCEIVTRAVVDEHGEPCGVVSTIRDISRHKARQRALQQVAARDSLTGADSRRAFLDKLDAEIQRARTGARSSLLLIDIDHFKAVNDRYGHGAGDRVLTAFVERLRPGLRGIDSIGRLGGEEFAILLTDSDVERSSLVCERLRGLLAEPMAVGAQQTISITFSAGLVELDGGSDRSTMLEAADKALYRAKHSGRNCLRRAA
ncbi:sensor domain-containing diguanylate cyclase [Sphingobium sp. CAP-1]|uniref:sensor domain-containing diguanylate cyclase n=1 Tax=Sphingobium sp. CAP-1 TaxID=2676077 RepID=UPI0012BB34C5|nr:sensor domain-containing diguanylate cyclase [Sphingobium sp. CAP-1]QGP79260.1 diguanylate cyclase [Sphingobium sp. CAP-1]